MSQSNVSNNTTTRASGAGGPGAGINIRQSQADQPTSASIADSTIENNDSIGLGGGDGIRIQDSNVEVTIEHSAIINNGVSLGSTFSNSPGQDAQLIMLASSIVDGEFALLSAQSGTRLIAINSTLSATDPANGLSVRENASAELLHSTIAVSNGSAISAASASATITITNSIVSGRCQRDRSNFTTSRSLFDDVGCALSPFDVVDDVGLLPIGSYGGPTPTHYLKADSPAIDVSLIDCLAPPVDQLDQRSEARPFGASCDAGAVEFAGELMSMDDVFADGFEAP